MIWNKKKKDFTDRELIIGLQQHDRVAEARFYDVMLTYFNLHFHNLFFNDDTRREIFQTALIKLWNEIENQTIKIIDGDICRRQRRGEYAVMTASLTTFFITFAKNEFRELLRSVKEDNYAEIFESKDAEIVVDEYDSEKDVLIAVIDECILELSPNCAEIITLFYHQQKSLDEIMAIRKESNSSKDGLKTAKNKCMKSLKEKVTLRFAALQ